MRQKKIQVSISFYFSRTVGEPLRGCDDDDDEDDDDDDEEENKYTRKRETLVNPFFLFVIIFRKADIK